jgi:hypothetical protein
LYDSFQAAFQTPASHSLKEKIDQFCPMKKLIIKCFALVLTFSAFAQSHSLPQKHLVRLSTGVGFDDGLFFSTKAPSIGISYEYALNQHFSLAAHLLSYYRDIGVNHAIIDTRTYRTAADLIMRGFFGPFLTQADLDRIEQTGIKKLSPERVLKTLSLPLDFGISFYPVNTSRHRMGINCALSLTYESYNFQPGTYTVELELKDGSIYRDIFISLNTEFRHLALGLGTRLFYEYHFNDYAVGLRLGSYNLWGLSLDTLSQGIPFVECSLFFAFKL